MNVESNAAKPAAPASAQAAGSALGTQKSAGRAAGLPGAFSEMLNQAREVEQAAPEPEDKSSLSDEPIKAERKTSADDSESSAKDEQGAATDTPVSAAGRSDAPQPRPEAQPARAENAPAIGEKTVTPTEVRKTAAADDLRKGAAGTDPKTTREAIDPATLAATAGGNAGTASAVQTAGARSSATRLARADLEASSTARLADQRDDDGAAVLATKLEGQNKSSALNTLMTAAGMAGGRDPAQPDATSRLLSEIASLELKSIDGRPMMKETDSSNLLTLPQTLASGSLSATDITSSLPLSVTASDATYSIAAPLGTPSFTESLASHIGNMTTNSIDRAEIQLNPRDLGPIRIEVSVKDDETSIVLTAAQPMTMAALEQGTATLRTLLADQGLNLRQLDIQSGSNPQGQSLMNSERQGQDSGTRQGTGGRAGPDQGFAGAATVSGETRPASHRLLDLFA